jgi:hypothetical protein
MNPERHIPSEANLANSPTNPELEQKRQEMLGIVEEAISSSSFSDRLDPNQRDALSSSVTDAFVRLEETYGRHWRSLSIMNEYSSTINNRNIIVGNNDPGTPLFDLEEICKNEAFANIRNRRRLVKNAFQKTLSMLQTSTKNAKDCKDLQELGKQSMSISRTPSLHWQKRFED